MEAWHEAWHRDCATVGLAEPSSDLGEIKRAYAKTLRKTRPDDDALAYQALREAYDRLVAHAQRQQAIATQEVQVVQAMQEVQEVQEVAEAREEAREVPPEPGRRAQPAPPVFVDPSPGPTPEALCEEVVDQLKRGRAQLEAAMPALRRQLGELSLERQLEASARFADLVVQLEAHLPPRLIDMLREHFAWSRDFRIERMLGAERMAALAEVLERHPPPITDPATLAEFAPTVRVAQLSNSMLTLDKFKAFVGALLMGHTLALHLQWAGWQLLRRLRVDEAELGTVQKLTDRTRNAALPLIALLAGVLDAVLKGSVKGGFDHAFSTLLAVGMFCGAMGFLGQALDFLREAVPAWMAEKLRSERWDRVSPWIGAASFAAAGLALQLAPMLGDAIVVGSLGFLAVGLLLGLKGPNAMITTAVALWGAIVWTVPTMWPVIAGLLAAWVSAGVTVYRLRLYVPNPTFSVQPTRPAGGLKAIALLLTVGLPTLMAWLSSLAGMRLTLGAIALALTVPRALGDIDPLPRAALVLGALYLAMGLWLAAQRGGWQLARRLFRDRPTASAADGGR